MLYIYIHVTFALDDDDDAHALPSHTALKIGTRPAVSNRSFFVAVTIPPKSLIIWSGLGVKVFFS